MDDSFWEITEDLRHDAAWEQRTQADAIEAGGTAGRSYRDELRRVAPGELLTVVTSDGATLAGRLLAVGLDWVRLGEARDPLGASRARVARVHDIRLAAVVRLMRDPELGR